MWTPPDLAVTGELLRRMLVGKPGWTGMECATVTPLSRKHVPEAAE